MVNNSVEDIKVFGMGLSKTGTKSLANALSQFGLEIIHFPSVNQLIKGNGAVDTPVIAFLPQLLQLFPNAKFICTTRDIDDWLVSCKKHFKPSNNYYIHQIRMLVYGSILPKEDDFIKTWWRHQELIKSLNPLIINVFNDSDNSLHKIGEYLNLIPPNINFPHIK